MSDQETSCNCKNSDQHPLLECPNKCEAWAFANSRPGAMLYRRVHHPELGYGRSLLWVNESCILVRMDDGSEETLPFREMWFGPWVPEAAEERVDILKARFPNAALAREVLRMAPPDLKKKSIEIQQESATELSFQSAWCADGLTRAETSWTKQFIDTFLRTRGRGETVSWN
jgi:hypothetical protein